MIDRISDHELIARLEAVTSHVLDQPDLLAEWTRDFWPVVATVTLEQLPAAAVLPDTAGEVAAIVEIAAAAGRPVLIKGGGSSLVGSIEPVAGAIVIDTRGLNVIDVVNEVDHTVTADAGVYGGELEERLNELGFTLGFFPQSMNISTVGGWIASGASGVLGGNAARIEDLLHAIDVVLPDGTRAHCDVSSPLDGSRWPRLLVGSEGRSGIVTAATLSVRPIPAAQRFHAFSVLDYSAGLSAMRQLIQSGCQPAFVRLLDPEATRQLCESAQMELDGNVLLAMVQGDAERTAFESRVLERAMTGAGLRSLDPGLASHWFDGRNNVEWLIEGSEDEGCMAGVIDLAAPWSKLETVIEAVRGALHDVVDQLAITTYQPTPHSAAFELVIAIDVESDDEAIERYHVAWRNAVDAAVAAGGWRGHHGGSGQARPARRDDRAFLLEQRIQLAFDPDGRFGMPDRPAFG